MVTSSPVMTHDVAVPTQEWVGAGWRFHLALPMGFRAFPGPPVDPGYYPQLITRYELGEPRTTVEVRAAELAREVDAADWLGCSPVLSAMSLVAPLVSERRGWQAVADTEWQREGAPWRGRFLARKAGQRMFVVGVRSPREHAARIEPLFERLRASFEPHHDAKVRFAEPLRQHGADAPITWKTSLPASWILELGSANSFQAENVLRYPGESEELVGKLAFAVLERSIANTPREVAALYLDAVREHGLQVHHAGVSNERARRPFVGAWQLVAPVFREVAPGELLPGEVRCRIACDERVWVLGGVLSMRREDHADAWMQNKRALDLLFLSLRLQP